MLTEWPLISAPMAEALIGASRAAVQRYLAWMEDKRLIREMTGQGRFRMWRAMVRTPIVSRRSATYPEGTDGGASD